MCVKLLEKSDCKVLRYVGFAEVYLWAYSIYACKVQMPNSRRQLFPTIFSRKRVCV